MDHKKRNIVCWEIESVNDTKNNKHNSFNQAIDTTAVLGRQSHFGPAVVLSLVLSTPPYHSVLALLWKNIPFFHKISIFPTLNDAQRCALPCLKKSILSHRFLFTHRYTTDQGVPPPPPRGKTPLMQPQTEVYRFP